MTKAETIAALKEAWTRELMDEADLRDDITESYSAWVQGIVKQAAPDLQGQPAASGGGEQQGQAQGGQPQQGAAAQGGMQ